MNFDLKNNNTELYHLMRLALDSELFHFDEIYIVEQNFDNKVIVLNNIETQTKLTISLIGVSNFHAEINSPFFSTKNINNYKDYINFISINNFFIKNHFIKN